MIRRSAAARHPPRRRAVSSGEDGLLRLPRSPRAGTSIREHPAYGFELEPSLGLVPIGTDPDAGLWEFWHVATGPEPRRTSDGRLRLTEENGLVLVLIPGGTFRMGAQATDPRGRN